MLRIWRKFGLQLVTLLALLISYSVPAIANQEQSSSEAPTHVTEYKAYMAALKAGEKDAAKRHSKAAWQAAEDALGDHQLTAILAFNYAQQIYVRDPEAALVALQRADDLVQMGLVDLPEVEFELYMAYTEYVVSGVKYRKVVALRKALNNLEEQAPDSTTMDAALMWFRLAQGEMMHERYKRSLEAADKAESILNKIAPNNIDFLMQILLVRGVAKLMPLPRKTYAITEAYKDIDRAYQLPPPQKDFESFDPIFAQIIAWHGALHSAMKSKRKKGELLGSYPNPRPIFESDIDAPEDCGLEWETRQPPKYRSKAARKGYIGAVIVIYDISDTGDILNPRILSEVPADIFGDTVLESIENWRIKTMPTDRPGCRINQMTEFLFIISDRRIQFYNF